METTNGTTPIWDSCCGAPVEEVCAPIAHLAAVQGLMALVPQRAIRGPRIAVLTVPRVLLRIV